MSHAKVRLTIATRNSHKAREFAALLGDAFDISDLSKRDDLPEVEETGATFEENSTLKALTISRFVPGFVLADDSGLEVDELGGAPGVYSARFAGPDASDADNVNKLLAELEKSENREAESKARFRCVLVLAMDGQLLGRVSGEVIGRIVSSPRGASGFGYDPVFIPQGYDETFAELPAETKNQISHRAIAVTHFLEAWPRLAGRR